MLSHLQYRVLRALYFHLRVQKRQLAPRHLFAPIVLSSRNSLYDCDYNMHKSNSTYFLDFDLARANIMGIVLRECVTRFRNGDKTGWPTEILEAKGKYFAALGGNSCFYAREVRPFQAYDIYARVLTWDRKWLYLIIHVVEQGAIRPGSYVLQPWKHVSREETTRDEEDLKKHIFATSVARYCFKKGRITINPEIVLHNSALLPRRPTGVGYPPRSEAPDVSQLRQAGQNFKGDLNVTEPEVDEAEWTWDDMEKERLRGLDLAKHFDAMANSFGTIKGGPVIGRFGNYW
nr:uncharacterized protein CFP56_09729 [Quercus suber]